MYVRTTDALKRSIEKRKANGPEIRRRRDEWIRSWYGIEDFESLCRAHLPFLATNGDGTHGIVARQVASLSAEDIACFLAGTELGVTPTTLTFGRDCFVTGSFDKVARVKIPWIRWSRKGHMILAYERIVEGPPDSHNMRILRTMKTKHGTQLLEHHAGLRDRVFSGTYPSIDISQFHSESLRKAKRRPPQFVYKNVNGFDRRTEKPEFSEDDPLLCRPPSSWYYPLYFSWFLDGNMVLLETYENPAGGVPQAKRLFEETMRLVKEKTGWEPLVVEIPPLTEDMLYHNEKLLTHPMAITKLEELRLKGGTTCEIVRKWADAVIAFR